MTAAAHSRTPVVCGVDVGSTNLKVVALDREGRVLSRAHRPTPREDGDPSTDARALLHLLEDMIVEVCGVDLCVQAVAVAGVGEDGVLVDERQEPLVRALAWFDPRREAVFRDVLPRLARLADVGVPAEPSRTLVGWAWTRRSAPHVRAQHWIALTDHPASAWTGVPFVSDTVAARTAAWAWDGGGWVVEHVRATLGDEALLPPVMAAGTVLGPLRSRRLAAAGVLAPTAVAVVGGHDHPVAGWAVDRLRAGAVLDSMGTAEVVVAHGSSPVGPRAALDVGPGVGSRGATVLAVAELGRNVAWAAEDPAVAEQVRRILRGDVEPVADVDPGGFTPGGRGGGAPRYGLGAPRDPLARASVVLAALARAGRDAVAAVSAAVPTTPPVYGTGGWSRSAGWLRLKERAGTPLRVVPEPEVTAVGAAMLAAGALSWTVAAEVALGFSEISV